MTKDVPKALALARAGDIAGAITAGEAELAGGTRDAGLAMFVGMLCGRQGELSRAIAHLRRAVALAPAEAMPKIELARALLSTGDNDEAASIAMPLAAEGTPLQREMLRILALATARGGDHAAAIAPLERLVVLDPADFESWRELGVARLATHDVAGAISALETVTRLRPMLPGGWVDLARAHAAGYASVAAEGAARRAVELDPADAVARLQLARALVALRRLAEARNELAAVRPLLADDAPGLCEVASIAILSKSLDAAELDYRQALAIDPVFEPAWLGLATVFERTNRPASLYDLVIECEAAGLPDSVVALPHARALRSEGKLEAAMALIERVPDGVDPVGRAQVTGDIADRLGDPDTAFAAFSQANALLAEAAVGSYQHAEAYRDSFRRLTDLLTPEWYASWAPPAEPSARRAPLFLFGFPRSGTTLIDTMLSGHPDAVVLEEEPVIDEVTAAVGAVEQVGQLREDEIERLRAIYFAAVDRIVPDVGDRLIVDKQPLALGSTPILHRIFPDARFLFAERHPCDVVLSCFITSAQMDAKVANFFDFTATARLYAQVLDYWTTCVAVLPIDLFTTRYERLIADPAAELRQIAAFAGLEWTPQLVDNQVNAAARNYIASPSYAQVAEPVYTRAKGRWRRYEQHMAPVMPILARWIDSLGYDA